MFDKLYFSQRDDGKGSHTLRKDWRRKWHDRFTTLYPKVYFVGYREPALLKPDNKDQKLWQLSKIWVDKKQIKKDTGY